MLREVDGPIIMNSNRRVSTDACLLIFDPHQDVAWIRGILQREQQRVSHLLLGGDYFDTFREDQVVGVEDMCDLLLELRETWQDRLTLLLGNHDVHYMEAKRWCDMHRNPKSLNYKCSGYTNNKAKHISKKLSWEFWRGCRLFQEVNGFLISHAGVAGRFWHSDLQLEAAIEALDGHCQVVLERLPFHSFAILKPGRARGGDEEKGGITWMDFDSEFSELEIPLPQIVGHTPSERGPRQNGRSWCLDGHQSCYGILKRTGDLEVCRL